MKLLFINSLKGMKKKKVQLIGIILLVMLSTGIYASMQLALDRMEEKYYEYLENQKVEHLSVDYTIDYKEDIDIDLYDNIYSKYFTSVTDEEKLILDNYRLYLLQKDYMTIDEVAFFNILNTIFIRYNADIYIKEKALNKYKDKYNYLYELEENKSIKNNDDYLKVIPYKSYKKLNKPYLIKGRLPQQSKEITMLPKYAKINNIKLNSYYKIGNKKYKVVGFTYAPDYIYPLVSYSALAFDEAKNNVIYVYNSDFKNIDGYVEKTYALYYKGGVERKFKIGDITSDGYVKSAITKIIDDDNGVSLSVAAATRLGRIASLQLEFASDRLFANYFLYLLLGISMVVIAIIVKRKVDDDKLQIGVLKALGYKSSAIAVSYLTYPIIGSIVGGVLGYLIGVLVNKPLANYYISWFLIPLGHFVINPKYLLISIFVPMLILSIICYILALVLLSKKPIDLLKEGPNLKIGFLSRGINKLLKPLSFKYRYKYSLAARSIYRLLVVALTSFFAGILISITLIGMNLMKDMLDKSFEGIKYNYMIFMNSIVEEELDDTADYNVSYEYTIKKISHNGKSIKVKKDSTISLTGIDQDSKYIDVYNKKHKDIKNLLSGKNIIINENIASLYNIKKGDIITLDTQNNDLFRVVEISTEYLNMAGYIDRKELCSLLGYKNKCYSSILSNKDNYTAKNDSDISISVNVKDMKDNIMKTINKYNGTIYIVVLFSGVMAFIIILIITNIIVDENKKIIALMKVMGYSDKDISDISLNIYTPIIIITYLLSIPVTIKLLRLIITLTSEDMNMTIPINYDIKSMIIGLVMMLGSYFGALFISKKSLRKIPLAVALKRE